MSDARGARARHDSPMEQQMNSKSAFDEAISAWNEGDLESYLTLYRPDAVLHGYTPEPLESAGIRAFYGQVFAAFSSMVLNVDEQIWDGDSRLAARATLTGSHVGDFMGVAPSGTQVVLPTITVLHFEDSRVRERWSIADMLGLMVQLGAVAAPS